MALLERVYYGNTLGKWIVALAIAACLWVLLSVLRRLIQRKVLPLSQRTATPVDDLVVLLVAKTRTWFLLVLSLYAGSLVLALPPGPRIGLGKFAVLVLLLQVAVWGTEVIAFWIKRSRSRKEGEEAAAAATIGLINFFARAALWTTILLLALDNLGVHVTTLIAGLGVGGVAVALALQSILSDLFASISILLDKPFAIGDFITVDDYQGTIEHVGVKTTRIRSLSGEELIFTNSDLLKSRIRNYKRMAERRIVFTVSVPYETPVEKLAAIPAYVKEVIGGQQGARFDRVHFKQIGRSSHDFEIVYWVTSPDYAVYMDVQHAINLDLLRRFEREGIALAYPTQALVVEQKPLNEAARSQAR